MDQLHIVYSMQNLTLVRTRARDQIRELLRERIVSGKIAGGDHLDEVGLAARLGASRTPLREALIALEAEGLVQSRPNHGFVVTMLDRRLVRELYPILAALEAAAVELGGTRLRKSVPALMDINARLAKETRAARRYALDREFHRTLTASCENERLLQLLEQHWNHARRIDGGERRGMADLEGSCAEHLAIVRQIEHRNLGAAAQLLRDHWNSGIDVVLRWMDRAQ